jgi:hypothetical protein
VASELVEQSLEKTTSGEAGESCVNEAVFKTPLKPGDVMNYDAVRCHWKFPQRERLKTIKLVLDRSKRRFDDVPRRVRRWLKSTSARPALGATLYRDAPRSTAD